MDTVDKICAVIKKIKTQVPSYRIGQAISNLGYDDKDIFFMSDEDILLRLENQIVTYEFYKETNKQKEK